MMAKNGFLSSSHPSGSAAAFMLRWLFLILLACVAGYAVLSLSSPRLMEVMLQDGEHTRTLTSEPYAFDTEPGKPKTLTLRYTYFLPQNGVIVIDTNSACVDNVIVRPEGLAGIQLEPQAGQVMCGEIRLNLAPYLLPGMNDIILKISSTNIQETSVYVASQLFGTHAASTIACLCMFSTFALGLFMTARRAGLNSVAAIILTAGFACYALLLHVRPNLEYSNDLPGHVSYIRYMLENGYSHPYGYDGWEHFHPPIYYFIASRFFGLTASGGAIMPLTLVRMLALFFYTTFMFFGLLTIDYASLKKGWLFYAVALLFVFWPIGPVMATRISNDIAVYASWAITFYLLTRWMNEEKLGFFQAAIVFTGIAFMFKSTAFPLIAVTGTCTLLQLARGRLRWRELFVKRSLLAFGFVVLCGLENTGKYIGILLDGGDTSDYLSTVVNEVHPLQYYIGFNAADFIARPTVTYDQEPAFLNYFLKTVLYNEQQLGYALRFLPGIENALLLALLLLGALGALFMLMRSKNCFKLLAPLLIGTLIPPLGPYVFMLMKRYMFCQSFRFIVPALIAFLALYMRTLEFAGGTRYGKILSIAGFFLACAMALVSILMNGWLYTHGYFM